MADLWVMIPKAGFERMVGFGGWWRSVGRRMLISGFSILVGVC